MAVERMCQHIKLVELILVCKPIRILLYKTVLVLRICNYKKVLSFCEAQKYIL